MVEKLAAERLVVPDFQDFIRDWLSSNEELGERPIVGEFKVVRDNSEGADGAFILKQYNPESVISRLGEYVNLGFLKGWEDVAWIHPNLGRPFSRINICHWVEIERQGELATLLGSFSEDYANRYNKIVRVERRESQCGEDGTPQIVIVTAEYSKSANIG